MKKENILTILIVLLIVLSGVWYVTKSNSQNTIDFKNSNNLKEQEQIVLPNFPPTVSECTNFIATYSCQEGVVTSEGLLGCNPQYTRSVTRCTAFLNGESDPYGNAF